VPVVLVTAAYHAVEAAEKLGAQACLSKPFELDELVDAVARVSDGDALTQALCQRERV
jgi:DNA-binding NarL/FixJ family response regulator